MNIIKAGTAVLRAHIQKGFKIPLSVYFFVTYRCPFKCRYCNITKSISSNVELSTEKILSIISQMAEAGTIKLQLTGGEPMVREDIGRIINHAKLENLYCGMSTSGYGIKEKVLELRNIDIVFLSLEGDEVIHDEIRGEGSYKIAEDAMQAMKTNAIKFWTTTVINKMNVNKIQAILDRALSDRFMANFVMLHPREDDYLSCFDKADDAEKYLLTPEQYKEAIKMLVARKKEGYPIGTSISYFNHLIKWKDYKKVYRTGTAGSKCWAGKLYAFMEPDGTLYPCGILHSKMKGVSVAKNGFMHAFNKLEEPYCSECLSSCHMEQNMMFSLDFNAIRNWYGLIK